MALETIPLREIEEFTKDMYEATLIVARRARQIIADRAVESQFEEIEDDIGILEEQPDELEDYVEHDKATTVALEEFLSGQLEWAYGIAEEETEEAEEAGQA